MAGNSKALATNDDYINEALQLAKEIGLDLETEVSLSSGMSNYTKYSLPEGVRYSVTYFDSGKFEWNAQGQEPDFKEQFYKRIGGETIEVSDFNEIGGYIVEFELLPRLAPYDEKNKTTKTVCSVIGYQTVNSDTGEAIAIRALPPVPLKSMYQWVGNRISYTTPEPLVERLGLIGSRGETCANCIRNGHSTLEMNGEEGTKVESCAVRGALFMVVHELTKVTKKPSKVAGQDPEEVRTTYNVSDLCDEEGNPKEPFLLAINITSLGLRGAWNNIPKIVGYFHHVSGLLRNYKGKDPRTSPKFHFTTLTLRKKEGGKKYQVDFGTHPADLGKMREAHEVWSKQKPNKDVMVINPREFSSYSGDTPDLAVEVLEDDFNL